MLSLSIPTSENDDHNERASPSSAVSLPSPMDTSINCPYLPLSPSFFYDFSECSNSDSDSSIVCCFDTSQLVTPRPLHRQVQQLYQPILDDSETSVHDSEWSDIQGSTSSGTKSNQIAINLALKQFSDLDISFVQTDAENSFVLTKPEKPGVCLKRVLGYSSLASLSLFLSLFLLFRFVF
ncbi:hypothetical protein GEMRC1_014131 [Eukaryota sp. GEM-RC1]